MTDKDTGHPEVDPNGPPLEWFEGRGPEGVGIETVFTSQKLHDLGGGEVGEQLRRWLHYLGSASIKTEEGWWKPVEEASEMPDDSDLKQRAVYAEQVIRMEIGFTPRQIMERIDELLGVFKGQFEAPFPVIFWHQRQG